VIQTLRCIEEVFDWERMSEGCIRFDDEASSWLESARFSSIIPSFLQTRWLNRSSRGQAFELYGKVGLIDVIRLRPSLVDVSHWEVKDSCGNELFVSLLSCRRGRVVDPFFVN